MKTVCSIHQPHYLPWLRYFDKIARSDLFILLDDAQFNKNGWQNRNKIKTPHGWMYITVPVRHKHRQRINDVLIDSRQGWAKKHWHSIKTYYQRAPYFDVYASLLKGFYQESWEKLIDLNLATLQFFLRALGITTRVLRSSRLEVRGAGTSRLLNLCRHVGATHYLAGAYSADVYLDFEVFKGTGIEVILQDWTPPDYQQLYPQAGFISDLSILDLLLNHGSKSLNILCSTKKGQNPDACSKEAT